jgi:cell division protein FtsX
MADEFERFLASSLAPPERLPDRRFVAAVHVRIELEHQLKQQRNELAASLGYQLIALFAVTAGVWWIARAAPIAAWLSEFPAVAFAVLLVAFALLVALISRSRFVALTMLNGD